jgi:hypothetical protein
MATVASVANTHNSRVEFQNIVAQSIVQEREQEIAEVRPTEENQQVDPDREHQKHEADQESSRSKKQEVVENEEKESQTPLHILDIKV